MPNEVVVRDEDEDNEEPSDAPKSVDEMRRDDPLYAPQSPGDPGYEPKAITPELDLEGGTKFVSGDEEYDSMSDALEAQADSGEGTALDQSQDPARLEAAEDDESR